MAYPKIVHAAALVAVALCLVHGFRTTVLDVRDAPISENFPAASVPRRLRPQGFAVAIPDDLLRKTEDQGALEMRIIRPELPRPVFVGSPMPEDSRFGSILADRREKNPPVVTQIMVPKQSRLISLGCPVSSSDSEPFTGELGFVTDGEIAGNDGYYVELGPGIQWVQIDLGKSFRIDALWVWRFFKQTIAYADIVIGVSPDPDFSKPKILFNSDWDNNIGFGNGRDLVHLETNFGRAILAHGVCGRYVRLYSNGRSLDEFNHYTEVSIYGRE